MTDTLTETCFYNFTVFLSCYSIRRWYFFYFRYFVPSTNIFRNFYLRGPKSVWKKYFMQMYLVYSFNHSFIHSFIHLFRNLSLNLWFRTNETGNENWLFCRMKLFKKNARAKFRSNTFFVPLLGCHLRNCVGKNIWLGID